MEGIYKMNYDGAIFTESGEAGIGVIVRDARGEVIAALAKKILYSGLVEVLEVLAARRAAKFAVELGLSSSIGPCREVETLHASLRAKSDPAPRSE